MHPICQHDFPSSSYSANSFNSSSPPCYLASVGFWSCGFGWPCYPGSPYGRGGHTLPQEMLRACSYDPLFCHATGQASHSAFWIADVPRPPIRHDREEPSPALNVTPFPNPTDPDASLISFLSSHPVWESLAADILLGQIIALLIVLTFVAVFLLREWVSQNARPGVFEDVDVPP